MKAKKPKTALLSYLAGPITSQLKGGVTQRFSNDGLALSWVKVLNELGYQVDVINWDDDDFTFAKQYDLIVSHGGLNYQSLARQFNPATAYVYFSTGSYWKYHNQQENLRFAALKKRRGVNLPKDRYIKHSEEAANRRANGIIVLGDPSMRETYPFERVWTVNNGSYPDDHFEVTRKDYEIARHNFLFFAGSGNVHKGLDLLLDSFKDLSEHLYIVSRPDPELMAVFAKELRQPNIHLVGEVNMRTAEFYDAMDRCAFVILPSCSEGQAGSVVECMNQGLIPIVSRETRLDARAYGAVLEKSSIAEIKSTVHKFAQLSPRRVAAMARRVHKVAQREHSPEHFERTLKKALEAILQP